MHHIDLSTIRLAKGAHTRRGKTSVCLLEAVAWFAGKEHTDHPPCVSPVLGAFGRAWNDALDDETRQRLVPLIPRFVGTAGGGGDERRAWLLTDWLVRTFAPARQESAAARDAAGDAARAAARDAAGDAARDAARDAAGDAARDAAGDAARDAARDAAGDAARDAAGDAAWDAAGDAAPGKRYKAARSAADEALAPTVKALQDSALQLLDRLLDAGKVPVPA